MHNDTAIMIFCYGGKILDITLSSLVKFFPGYDIYLLNVVEADSSQHKGRNWQPTLRPWINDCLSKYNGRIKHIDYNLEESSFGGAEVFLRFATEYPYKYYLKVDDDLIFTDYGLIDSLKDSLGGKDVLVAAAISPMQRDMQKPLNDLAHLGFSDELFTKNAHRRLCNRPDLMQELWDKTFPPESVIEKLRKNPTVNIYPKYGRIGKWSVFHYLIKRDDYLPLLENQDSDEHAIAMAHLDGKQIAINTHHLVYHHGYSNMKKWTNENITPIVRQHNFWKPNGTK